MSGALALACIGLLAFTAPVLAQEPLATGPNYGTGSGSGGDGFGAGGQTSAGGSYGTGTSAGTADTQSGSATDALAQAPGPFGNVSPFLVIGGIAGGAGLIAYAVSQNKNDETPTSP